MGGSKIIILKFQIRTNPSEKKGIFFQILPAVILVLQVVNLQAQHSTFTRETSDPFYQRYRIQDQSKEGLRFKPGAEFTSVAFTLPAEESFFNFLCIAGTDTLQVKPAAHQPEGVEGIVSELLFFNHPQAELTILPGREEKGGLVHLMYAPPLNEKSSTASRQRQLIIPCEKPDAVSQQVWREGLPEPQYQRDFNEVEHLIVHHSAGSNSATNYTELVRNIYLYHTRTNGWSDIGYNYLIAPDGTLFTGRDPGTGEQDNVRGAHFCGKNSQTMGVCLLGDFSATEPAPAALQRLEHLLTWKAEKEGLDPMAVSEHPASANLPVIAGHRNGCATQCPGEHVYEKLPSLRLAVAENLAGCLEEEEEEAPGEVYLYFSPKYREICLTGLPDQNLKALRLFNIQGKEVDGVLRELESEDFCFKITGLPPGVYFLRTKRGDNLIQKKFLIF